MTLETLQQEMILAMKNKNKIRKDTLSSLIGAIKKSAIDKKTKDNINEELVNEVILKEKKTVEEMIHTCPIERVNLLNEYHTRLDIINEFVPVMMSEDEIKEFINQELIELTSINETISPKIHGMVMKNISPKLKGKADMKLVNQILKELLNQ